MKQISFILFLLILNNQAGFSENGIIDSLRNVLKTTKDDTSRINTLNMMAWELKYSNPDSAFLHANGALKLSENVGFQKGLANSNRNLGVLEYLKGNYSIALDFYFKALKISEKNNLKRGTAATLGGIGSIYLNQSDYPGALEFYFKALKINEELDDKGGMATVLGNMGIIYKRQSNYPKALEYYTRALKLDELLGDIEGVAADLGNIGIIYFTQKNYPRCIEYYSRALKIYEETNDSNGISINLGNIGATYFEQGDYPKALEYYFKALEIDEKFDNKYGMTIQLDNIGSLYTKMANGLPTERLRQAKYKEAKEYLTKALQISKEIEALNGAKGQHQNLSDLYSQWATLSINSYPTRMEYLSKAFFHYKEYILLRDSIFNEENTEKSMRSEMNFEYEKKQAIEKAEHDKKMALADADKKKQRIIIWSVAGGLLLVLGFSGYILRSLRITRRQKEIIEVQKHQVEEHQKEIIDSITYAKRLQKAILPRRSEIHKNFPESFVLYKPKDIVAGDFYWMEAVDDTVYIAAADCTGHGVPGAMVSMVCSNALNSAVNEIGGADSGAILDKVRELVLDAFKKSGDEIKDGMDISFLKVRNEKIKEKNEITDTRKSIEVQWSGANNSLWYLQGDEFTEIKADKQPIGKYEHAKPFTTHKLALAPGSILYLFTDGFADQFGGNNQKKITKSKFRELIIASKNQPMVKQKEILEGYFMDWKGTTEQVDDVCVIGIKAILYP